MTKESKHIELIKTLRLLKNIINDYMKGSNGRKGAIKMLNLMSHINANMLISGFQMLEDHEVKEVIDDISAETLTIYKNIIKDIFSNTETNKGH